jgi:tetratricopeptide (TPR) repeat protein
MHFRFLARDFRIADIASIIFSAAMTKQLSKKAQQPDARKTRGTNRFVIPCILMAVVIAIVFFPSLKNGFTNWDDDIYVTNNPDIQKVTLHNIVKVFSSSYASTYQPFTMLAYMAEHAIDGSNPAVFHGVSVFLHILNCLLVFALLYNLSGNFFVGVITVLFFAIHPLRVESVAWVADQKDLLSTFFYLLSLLAYNAFTKNNIRKFYWISLIALVFSLLSKPIAMSLPFALFLMDYLCNKKPDKSLLARKIPFFMVASVFVVITLITQRQSGAINIHAALFGLDRFCVPFYGIVFYLIKFFIPIKLAALYPMPKPDNFMLNALIKASPFIVASIAALLWFFRSAAKIVIAGCLFFVITLLPVLQIVPIGSAIVSDRYSYLPLIGISGILGAVVTHFLQSNLTQKKTLQTLIYAGLALIFITLGILSFQRCKVWHDSLTLWNDDIAKYPSVLAYNNRATEFGARGETDRAIEDFTAALRYDPKFAKAYDNRGIAYISKGMADQAFADFSKAIELDSDYYDAYNNRGIIFGFYNEFDKAVADFSQAIALKSDYERAYLNRGIAYLQIHDFPLALKDFDKALELNPGDATALEKRGQAMTSLQKVK